MPRRIYRYAQPGSSPGHAIETAPADLAEARVAWIRYDATTREERPEAAVSEALAGIAPSMTDWLHFAGPPLPSTLRRLQDTLGLDPLALEDVHNGNQRSKLERFEGHSFMTLSVPVQRDGHVVLEQLSLFLGPHWVISFWPDEHDCFGPVRERLRSGGTGRIRKRGADYLFYVLLDAAVDSAFPLLDKLRDQVEELEESLLERSDDAMLGAIHGVRRDLVLLRRINLPGQEALGHLLKADDSPLSSATRRYVRDVLDHHIRSGDTVESLAEVVRGLHELYLASLSHRMNDVMKLLTMIATIFIPLTFVTGLYGMNFNPQASAWNMPELNSPYGYPAVLVVLFAVGAGMLWMFRRRGWL